LIVVFEGEVEVEVEAVPYTLPDANPVVRGAGSTTGQAAPPVDKGGGAAGNASLLSCRKELWVLSAALAIPGATGRHAIEASAEDMTQLLATVAIHKLGRVPKLVADHASIVAPVILKEIGGIFLNNHGRIKFSLLFLVFDSV
jgi:hypothetical protein